MTKFSKPKTKLTFSNNGVIICDSYEKGKDGISWTNGTIHGYSTNDLVKKIEEVKNDTK